MAGQFCFCGDFGRGVDAGVGKDAGGGLVGCVGGVLFIVDGDAGKQGAVEDASFGWGALVVEVDEEFGELVEHVGEDLPDVLRLGQGVALVGAFDLGFGAFGEDRGAGA